MQRDSMGDSFPLGSKLPKFELKNVNGEMVNSEKLSEAKLIMVAFTCNHCPYVKGSESEIIRLAKKYQSHGLAVLTINSNDAIKYPDDSFENMQKKAKSLKLPYPYLLDETQEVAKLFDAACTPECYLFDAERNLIWHGTVCDNNQNSSHAKQIHLEVALEQALQGVAPDPAFVHPMGCSIKWR